MWGNVALAVTLVMLAWAVWIAFKGVDIALDLLRREGEWGGRRPSRLARRLVAGVVFGLGGMVLVLAVLTTLLVAGRETRGRSFAPGMDTLSDEARHIYQMNLVRVERVVARVRQDAAQWQVR